MGTPQPGDADNGKMTGKCQNVKRKRCQHMKKNNKIIIRFDNIVIKQGTSGYCYF